MNATWPDHFSPRVVGVGNGSSGLSSVVIALEAWRRGLEVTFTKDVQNYSISDSEKVVEFNYSRPESITRKTDYQKLDRKTETIDVLRQHGVPVPDGLALETAKTSLSDLQKESERIGYPLVIKPDVGSFGAGVLTDIRDWEELKTGYEYLLKEFAPARILMEKHHKGLDHRLLVVGDQVIGVAQRIPAHVIGDGESSITDLIAQKNEGRRKNPFLAGGLIKVDYEVEKCLSSQQLALSDVPEVGAYVSLRRVANASAGGDVVDVTNAISDEIKDSAVRAVKAFPRLIVAGVDMLIDPDGPNGNYVVIEINARPHIGVNMYPSIGEGRDAPNAIIDMIFPNTRRPKLARVKTLRFDKSAAVDAMRSGVTAKVILPSIPQHKYPYRQRLTFPPPSSNSQKKPLPRQALLKLAHKLGVIGDIQRNSNGVVTLTMGAGDEARAQKMAQQVQDWADAAPISRQEWRGPITTSFQVR